MKNIVATYNKNPFLEFNIKYCSYIKDIFCDYDEFYKFLNNCSNDNECEKEILNFLNKIIHDYSNFDALIREFYNDPKRFRHMGNEAFIENEVIGLLTEHINYYVNARCLDFTQFVNFIEVFEHTKEYVKDFSSMLDMFHVKVFPNKIFGI